MSCKDLQQHSQYSFFNKILKTSRVTSLIVIWKSPFNLLSYSEGRRQKATSVSYKLMKSTDYRPPAYGGANQGLWKT